ncbi:hypothetical protein J1C67_12205 [Clostridium gasigenes]|uniref:hypothetical protein n=1 Tax=Clostridium gasigenes TaxID=94869 RepID=UPI0014384C51|nr:hypothetical protein [Clostridium gasigenes]MBU3109503.1 hypothetical protein [Clostridium gasigenes]NKF07345.1 hypothetical protein [Clostridium gasigenes]QSW18318.1 hypothetical protein J1C67_12205 [Clostridium gasigenes]
MNIYLYKDYLEWQKDEPFESMDGILNVNSHGLITIETSENYKTYKQILSFDKLFAIVYKLPYGYITYPREINIFENMQSWSISTPEATFTGELQEDECSDSHITFNTTDGFKQIISLSKIFAVTYES